MQMRQNLAQIVAAVTRGQRKAVGVCQEALDRIAALDVQTGAFLEITREHALEQAAAVDEAVAARRPVGPLAGVPVAVKDNICTTFGHTTCASKILAGYVSPYNATVIDRIEAAGAVVIGKTNLDEFAMGSSCENSALRQTRNPWNTGCVPGGSSGGSAVAVAGRLVPAALGSDTGGSIRLPAAYCGIVGVKPTYGRVSRYGLVAYGSSLDQIGPLATCVEDAALLLGVISGRDARDSTSVDEPVPDYREVLEPARLAEARQRLRVGVPREYFGEGLDDEVRTAVQEALAVFRDLGATIVDVSLPRTGYAIPAYYLVVSAEASSNLARYDGVHYGHRTPRPQDIIDLYTASRSEGFGAEVKRRIMLGTFALSAGYHDAWYKKALKLRRLIKDDFDAALSRCDVVIGPTAPSAAFRLGEKLDDPLAMFLQDVYTVSLNLAGLPAVSMPCGFGAAGLPIGMQLMGRVFAETTLLQAARLYEQATAWHERVPPASAVAPAD